MLKRLKTDTNNSFWVFIQKKTFVLAFFIAIVIVFGLFGIFRSNDFQNVTDSTTVNWGDGTDAFYNSLLLSYGNFEENMGEAVFENQVVESISKQQTESILAQARLQQQVLGSHTTPDGVEKWVEVDLSDKKLFAWEGNQKVYEFLVSTGRPGYKTPTGEFRVWRKVLSQRYKGGIPGTSGFYNLPNVPYSLFWGGENVPNMKGYALHGAYWHNDFGIKNRSSGCVNIKPEEAGLLYVWAGPSMPIEVKALNATSDNPGIKVVIHE